MLVFDEAEGGYFIKLYYDDAENYDVDMTDWCVSADFDTLNVIQT